MNPFSHNQKRYASVIFALAKLKIWWHVGDMEQFKTFLKAKRGNLSRIAEHLGLTPATVHCWPQVPAVHVNQVSQFTGIPREVLRPDVFGPPQ
jgi:hypothetical protein